MKTACCCSDFVLREKQSKHGREGCVPYENLVVVSEDELLLDLVDQKSLYSPLSK